MIDVKILAIESATSACSAALKVGETVYQRSEIGNNIHSQVLLSMVDEIVQESCIALNQLDAVAVGQGPGSFTGLRIGVGVAQGIAYGVNCPMLGISSLDALANEINEDSRIIAGIDARMGEIYWCEYQRRDKELIRCSSLSVSSPANVLPQQVADYYLVGNAWQEYRQSLPSSLLDNATEISTALYPSAASLLSLAADAYVRGEMVLPQHFAPHYVRDDVAKKSTKTFG